ncbi:hypothetical protein ABT272_34020, partial [Streptomyces sp900105245]
MTFRQDLGLVRAPKGGAVGGHGRVRLVRVRPGSLPGGPGERVVWAPGCGAVSGHGRVRQVRVRPGSLPGGPGERVVW